MSPSLSSALYSGLVAPPPLPPSLPASYTDTLRPELDSTTCGAGEECKQCGQGRLRRMEGGGMEHAQLRLATRLVIGIAKPASGISLQSQLSNPASSPPARPEVPQTRRLRRAAPYTSNGEQVG